ncbi:microcin C ABC transporter permease YejB [Roseateles toxinivorans]|uniref:Microcin C transport system permease protein n=1 Tax=Roseateles toxinivorans TaxID=270368 RepID=A0A4V3CTG9_9BURK|nr:ABC transporter permease subunit [Roseateles toxinivorans]TDP72264.1 microcin C transport system permease protein [Roseateles toxinivorans]
MLSYLIKRVLLMLPTLLGALTLTFVVVQFVPGGPVEQIMAEAGESASGATEGFYSAGRDSDPRQVEELKKLYGFDKPPLQRYLDMLWEFVRLDLGRSFQQNKSVWALIVEKLPVSISLGVWSMLLSYAISVPLGIAKAVRQGQRFDVITSLLVLLGYAIPGFVLGVLLIVLFAGGSFFELFPLRGLTSDGWADMTWPQRIADYGWHLTLPLICMTLGAFAVTTMLTKNAFLEEIRKQYVLVARAKGLSERTVLWKHVFRNALIPLVTGFPAAFIGAFFAGSVLIETLFSLDGLGLLAYESVVRRDYPVVLGSLYLFTLLGLVVKLLSDVLYVLVDPRVQFGAMQR